MIFDMHIKLSMLRSHYSSLAEDETGHSKDPTHWKRVNFPEELEADDNWRISVESLHDKIRQLAKLKAVGSDGIPNEVLKAAAKFNPENELPPALFKAIQALFNSVLRLHLIPGPWNIALVVSIPNFFSSIHPDEQPPRNLNSANVVPPVFQTTGR
jgi:hypothetical protein